MLHFFGKRLAELHEKNRDERGFTLIELLVVVIIIGILAAIAIPTFLAQRERAAEANIASDVRNAAAAATTCLSSPAGNNSYLNCDTVAQLQANGFNPSDDVNLTDAMMSTTTADVWTLTGVTHDITGANPTGSFSTGGGDAGQVVITP